MAAAGLKINIEVHERGAVCRVLKEAKNRWGFLGKALSWPQAPQKENSQGKSAHKRRQKPPPLSPLLPHRKSSR